MVKDKIWVELEVEADRDKKTEKLTEVMKACSEIKCVLDVSKITYQHDIKELTIKTIE